MGKTKSNFSKFMLLWTGEFVSSIGGGLTSFGLGVYVFNQTGSAASMALVTLLTFLPTLLFSVPAGVLADRYDRRLLMMMGGWLIRTGNSLYINLHASGRCCSLSDLYWCIYKFRVFLSPGTFLSCYCYRFAHQ